MGEVNKVGGELMARRFRRNESAPCHPTAIVRLSLRKCKLSLDELFSVLVPLETQPSPPDGASGQPACKVICLPSTRPTLPLQIP